MIIVKRFDSSSTLRILRRKLLLVPALIFLLAVVVIPRERIGPPPDLQFNYILHDFTLSFSAEFQVYDIEPYLPRIRVTYSYQIESDEIISCNLLVLQDESVVANVTTNMYRLPDPQSESSHSVFDLSYGNYSLFFTQIIFTPDGYPTTHHRNVHVVLEQMQDPQWIDESILWDQYFLFLILSGFSFLFIGIYVTDHAEDNEIERERYERRKRGERNYPYWRADRRKYRKQQWAERMREKR